MLDLALDFHRKHGPRSVVGRPPVLALSVTNRGSEAVVLDPPEVTVERDGRRAVHAPDLADLEPRDRRRIEPGATARVGVALEDGFAFTEPGSYAISARCGDARSAPLAFEVEDPGPPPRGVTLALEVAGADLRAVFANASREPFTVVVPEDGSEWGWVEPHYWFVVRDASDRIVPPGIRCGNRDEPRLETRAVAPGGSVALPVHLPCELDGGRYRVALHYVVTRRLAPGVGPVHARSSEVTLEVPGPARRAWLRGPLPEAVTRLLAAGDRESLGHVERLLALGVLGEEERARIRRAVAGRPDAIRLLARVADASCVPALRAALLDPAQHFEAAWGLESVLGRRAILEVVRDLEAGSSADVRALLEAASAFSDVPPCEVPEGANRWRRAESPAELEDCRRRFLEWWRAEGPRWLEGKRAGDPFADDLELA